MMKMTTHRTGSQCVSVSLPELLQLSNHARQFSLSALRNANSQSGHHLSRLLGRGMEYAESRRYQAGDDIRNMDWRVTARTGKPHTKLFAAEKERPILLWVDMRASMFFATKGVFKSVQAALMMGYMAWNAIQTGNRLGGMIFDDANQYEFRPTLGKRGVLPFLERLSKSATFSSNQHIPSDETTMDRAVAGIQRLASPGSLVFMVSDFRNLSNASRDLFVQVSRNCDLCLCFLYDPLEAALPGKGYYPVTNGATERQINTFHKGSLEKYQLQFKERKEKVQTLAGRNHIHFMECSTEDDCLDLIKKHFN